ncbi:MAG: Cof-type HAD-IIB family hydrolase [Erysipelotrichaceae bacterium]|nr:Cof-type HAD-IIB family hydrolase [Erysipelotrichaceae bacterium]
MIKAIFMDFDGTVYSHTANGIPASTIDAINSVRKKGIKVFLCTGRAYPELWQFDISELILDGKILSNGQLILDTQEEIIYKRPINGILKEKMVRMFHEMKVPIYFGTLDDLVLNYANDFIVAVQKTVNSEMPVVKDYQGEDFYMASAFIEDDIAMKEVMSLKENAEITFWHKGAVDIVPKGVSKALGIDEVLKIYDIGLSETMGIGDGENDIEMFRHCGISVAMGNSSPDSVKEAADYVTDDIDDDGFYKALQYYELI